MVYEFFFIICWFFCGFIIFFFFWYFNEWFFVYFFLRMLIKCFLIILYLYCSNFNELIIFFFCNFYSLCKIDEKDCFYLNKFWYLIVWKILNFYLINVDFICINYFIYLFIIRFVFVVYKSIFSKWIKY